MTKLIIHIPEINHFVCGAFLVNYTLILVDLYVESFGKIEEVNMVGYFQLLLLFAVKHFLQLKLGKASSLIFILNCKLQSSSCLTDGRVEK